MSEAPPAMGGRDSLPAGFRPLDSRMHHAQADQILERIEVAITMQQRMPSAEAERRDQAVDGLANDAPLGTESAVVLCGSHREVNATGFEVVEASQVSEDSRGFPVGGETLQDLADHHVQQPRG